MSRPVLTMHRQTSEHGTDRFQTRCRKCAYQTKWTSKERHAQSSGIQHAQMKHLETIPIIERHYREDD